jgi:hypothetical protein
MSDPIRVDLKVPVVHVDVAPGGELILRGSFTSAHDGSVIDAATLARPGMEVAPYGLVDFERSGLHMTSRDPKSHEVHAVANGEPAAACELANVAPPCVSLRVAPLAHAALMTAEDFRQTLQGGLSIEVVAPTVTTEATAAASSHLGAIAAIAGALAVGAIGLAIATRRKRFAASPAGKLVALAKRVQERLSAADQVVAAPLVPALEKAVRAAKSAKLDAASPEAKRVEAALLRVDARITESQKRVKTEQDQEIADELVREMEAALEAADEVVQHHRT